MSSDSEPLLVLDGIGKTYYSYAKPYQRLANLLLPRPVFKPRAAAVLREVSFSLARGDTLGIIGRNGAGKSTLLQVICGVLQATTGQVQIRGKIAALLELGAGFNPDFSGRENIYLNAAIHGLSRDEIDERIEAIIDYSGVRDHIDQPVRHYSSGMYVRLAFSIIVHVDADILIIDEALAVGDALFAQKCMRFLEDFKERGAIIFVSHDSGSVTRLCDRVVWLEAGRCKMAGDAKAVTEAYLQHIYAQQQDVIAFSAESADSQGAEPESVVSADGVVALTEDDVWHDARHDLFEASTLRNDIAVVRFDPRGETFGTGKVKLLDVRFRDGQGRSLSQVVGGRLVALDIRFSASENLDEVIVGFLVKNRLGQVLFGENNAVFHRDSPVSVAAGSTYTARFDMTLPYLAAGEYVIAVGIASGNQLDHVQHCWQHDALLFTAHSGHVVHGLLGVPVAACSIAPVDA